jgi:formylglycine-generating enzyme required for sulfatase activity
VIRGGGWSNRGRYCRAAFRVRDAPSFRYDYLGFRVAAVPQG